MDGIGQFFDTYQTTIGFVGLNAMLALSVWLTLYTGQLTLGNAAFAGIAAYSSALLTMKAGLPFPLALAGGALLAAAVSLPLGVTVFRLRGVYLAIATLALRRGRAGRDPRDPDHRTRPGPRGDPAEDRALAHLRLARGDRPPVRAPARLERRPGLVVVDVLLEQLVERAGVQIFGELPAKLVLGRVDEVDPAVGARRPKASRPRRLPGAARWRPFPDGPPARRGTSRRRGQPCSPSPQP